MDHNSIGVDRESEGQDMDERTCPDECRGENAMACSGCPYYDEDGNPKEG